MNQTASVKLTRILAWIIAGILLLLPFHAFLTVWLSSLVGHYTLLRLWKEFLLVVLVAGAVFILAGDKPLRRRLFDSLLARLIGLYSLLLVIWAFVPLAKHDVTGKAMWYGLLVDLRFLVFFLAVWVIAAKSDFLSEQWKKLLLGPAVVVTAFAAAQYWLLPTDFLRHFGYGDSTIFPYETINHNINHIRVASTLRGANPLGAYLVMPLSALGVLIVRNRTRRRDGILLILGLLLALIFSFSRSAWLGAVISLAIIAWTCLKSQRTRRFLLFGFVGLVIIGGLLTIALRNNTSFENAFLHTDNSSTAQVSSNQGHTAAFKDAVKDIAHQPLGGGVGTAGPESVYNNQPARIAENYFLQIGQEAGVAGMGLFIAICVLTGKMLWARRADPLALWLFASLVGISFINLLSHAWTDDTLAYIWWGLAGLALAPAIATAARRPAHRQSR